MPFPIGSPLEQCLSFFEILGYKRIGVTNLTLGSRDVISHVTI